MLKNGLLLLATALSLFSCRNDTEGNRANIDPQRPAAREWSDLEEEPSYKKLLEVYTEEKQKEILQSARDSIFRYWNGEEAPALPVPGPNEGLAIRLIVHKKDRGCLAWYKNCGDMNLFAEFCAVQALMDSRYEPVRQDEAENTLIELTIFGDWEDMRNSEDFIPGYHNLWLINGVDNTILQASLVPERNYTKEDFLETICIKAGLDRNAWNENKDLIWRRSPGLWHAEQLVQ